MHKYGIITVLPFSKYASPIFAQRKPNIELRLLVDLRKINSPIADDYINNNHPVRTLSDAAQHLAGKSLFCRLDCSQVYPCLRMRMADQRSVEMLAFNFASRTFAYRRLAQALSRFLSDFSSFMRQYLDPVVKADQCAQYVDFPLSRTFPNVWMYQWRVWKDYVRSHCSTHLLQCLSNRKSEWNISGTFRVFLHGICCLPWMLPAQVYMEFEESIATGFCNPDSESQQLEARNNFHTRSRNNFVLPHTMFHLLPDGANLTHLDSLVLYRVSVVWIPKKPNRWFLIGLNLNSLKLAANLILCSKKR